jgi:gamma-glutamylcyclotransferase (GGCT)/AIG2-like uncharacterized protein YtfP
VLADQRFLGEAVTQPHYALLHLGAYPGLIHRARNGRAIRGELYEVAVRMIETLDEMEGAPRLFRLERVHLEGHASDVLAYFYQQDADGCSLSAEDRWRNKGAQP